MRFQTPILISLFIPVSALFLVCGIMAGPNAETGMGIVSDGGLSEGIVGAIRRIDLVNDVVQTATNSLGNGSTPRFSPDGKKFCFLRNGSGPIVIATIDGQEVRTISVSGINSSWSNLSWTNGGIWLGVSGKLTKYDTLGNQLDSWSMGGNNARGIVSQNEITGGSVNTSYRPVVFQMRSHTVVNAPLNTDGCSVCPSPNGLLLTNNIMNSPDNNGVHRTMRLIDTLGNQVRLLRVQDITKFTASNMHGDGQCFSGNSNDWICIPVGPGGTDIEQNASACIYNINDGRKFCLKDNSTSNGVFWQIWDYYSGYAPGGAATPTLQVSPASLSFAADSGKTPNSQNATASTPAGSLAGLAVSGGTAWLTVTPAAFSGQSISIVNAINMANLAPATYNATITVSTTNAGSKTYAVSLVVTRPAVVKVLTSMTVSPRQYTVAAGSPIGFNATCKDQSNNYFAGATIGWSASGGGTIGATSGVYTAAAAPSNGPHRIIATATAGGVTLRDTALLIVSRAKNASIHRRIDCGSNALLPTGWETDDAYVTGGSDGGNLATVSTAGVCGAAPADVYRTIRTGNHSYLVPLTIQDPYTVRLHFADSKDTLRHMAYSILGNSVLIDFSPSALAGGANKALALDFPVIVQDQRGLSVNCSAAAGGSVFEAGIEVMRNILQAHTLLSPLGGEKYSVGQTVQIKWVGDTMAITQTYIELSIDNGKTYNNFTGEYGLKRIDMGTSWGTYGWKIPDTLDTDNGRIATVSPTCRIRIRAYDVGNHLRDMSDSAFTISAQATAIPGTRPAQRADRLEYRKLGNGMKINAVSSSAFVIDIFAVSGERLHSLSGKGRCAFFLPKSSGVAIIRMKAGNGTTLSKATIE